MDKSQIKSYRDLFVWQKSMDLVIMIYNFTDCFPKTEIYGLTSQMRRAAVSIPSNIAEGRRRGTRKELKQFLVNAYGSGAELETQIEIAKRLSLGKNFGEIEQLLTEIMKMLNRFIYNLQPKS